MVKHGVFGGSITTCPSRTKFGSESDPRLKTTAAIDYRALLPMMKIELTAVEMFMPWTAADVCAECAGNGQDVNADGKPDGCLSCGAKAAWSPHTGPIADDYAGIAAAMRALESENSNG